MYVRITNEQSLQVNHTQKNEKARLDKKYQ